MVLVAVVIGNGKEAIAKDFVVVIVVGPVAVVAGLEVVAVAAAGGGCDDDDAGGGNDAVSTDVGSCGSQQFGAAEGRRYIYVGTYIYICVCVCVCACVCGVWVNDVFVLCGTSECWACVFACLVCDS